jgi:hypothetical protein
MHRKKYLNIRDITEFKQLYTMNAKIDGSTYQFGRWAFKYEYWGGKIPAKLENGLKIHMLCINTDLKKRISSMSVCMWYQC